MKKLQEYCDRFANNEPIQIEPAECPEKYIKKVHTLIDILRNKTQRADSVLIPGFIETALDNINVDDFVNEDIPDGIFDELSKGIYKKPFNSLKNEEQNIVKTMSAYVYISIK